MNIIEILTWIFMFMALAGSLLNAFKKKLCFPLWSIANIYLIWFNWYIKVYAQSFLFFAFLVITLFGWYKWTKEGEVGNNK